MRSRPDSQSQYRRDYLGTVQRAEAVALSRELKGIDAELRCGWRDWSPLETAAMQTLSKRSWSPDYVAVRRRVALGVPRNGDALVVVGEARLGAIRLIDNLEVDVVA